MGYSSEIVYFSIFVRDLVEHKTVAFLVPYLFMATLHLPQGIIVSFGEPMIRIVVNFAFWFSSVIMVPMAFSSPWIETATSKGTP